MRNPDGPCDCENPTTSHHVPPMNRASVNREHEALLNNRWTVNLPGGLGSPNLPVQRQPPNLQNEVRASRHMRAHCPCLSLRARQPGPTVFDTPSLRRAAACAGHRAGRISARRRPWSAAAALRPRPQSSSLVIGRCGRRIVARAWLRDSSFAPPYARTAVTRAAPRPGHPDCSVLIAGLPHADRWSGPAPHRSPRPCYPHTAGPRPMRSPTPGPPAAPWPGCSRAGDSADPRSPRAEP